MRRSRGFVRLAAAAVAGSVMGTALVLGPSAVPAAAAPPAPVILNDGPTNGGTTQWMETQTLPDRGVHSSARTLWATFLVQHAPGRTIPQVEISAHLLEERTTTVDSQTYVGSAGGLETSRVTVAVDVFGAVNHLVFCQEGRVVRTADAGMSFRAIDNTGEKSPFVHEYVEVVEDTDCRLGQDYPVMQFVSQTATEVAPNEPVTYHFDCFDPDSELTGGGDDHCARAKIRWRRLDDGMTSGPTLKIGSDHFDSQAYVHTTSFPSPGYYVVEAQLGNENGEFPNTDGPNQGWWRVGNAVVNYDATLLSGSLSLSGTQASNPPSVNAGTAVIAQATAADAVEDSKGTVQVIEWDADGDETFERLEYTVPLNSGAIVHPPLSAAELSQGIPTSTPGLKTIRARITDNGALDAADNIRRQLTFSTQLRVNAVPTASNVSVSTDEDTPVTISMTGSDPDGQPAPLAYGIVAAPPAAAGSVGVVSGNQVVFTPAPDFNGSTSFTYRVQDGPASNNGAWAFSNTATVNITVRPVNDLPTVDAKSASTDEDTPVQIQATGQDVEGPLTWSVASPPSHGTASCNPSSGVCTHTPDPNFFGTDSFVVRGTDTNGASATATFSVDVRPVNDAPIPHDQTLTVAEDSDLPITLTAADVDSTDLTFTAPVDDVDRGSLVCDGTACTYTPLPNYNGPDAFTFRVSDGELTSTATVRLTVTPVNDAPVAVDTSATTDEEVSVVFPLPATDVDGDELTYSIASQPEHGTVVLNGNSATYTPELDFDAVDTFTFRATDPSGASSDATATITVIGAPKIETNIEADPAVHVTTSGPAPGASLLQLSATLREDGGTPLAGRRLDFHAGDEIVCSAVTDGNGRATCPDTAPALAAIAAGGYRVTFAGGPDHLPSEADGAPVAVR